MPPSLPLLVALALTLAPPTAPRWQDSVIVTASGRPQGIRESPTMVTVVGRDALTHSPASALDQQLADVPGLRLFRRADSLAANPTAQGFSLRGIGPSGTSRSLLLLDGVPLNDPFGGWVYWNRIPASALARAEVARGAGSALYGSAALGGVVQLLLSPPRSETRGRLALGEDGWRDAEVTTGHAGDGWGLLLSARRLGRDGYHPLAAADRGAVDRPLDLDLSTVFVRLAAGRMHLDVGVYDEQRGNGTVAQRNDSRLDSAALGFRGDRWQWTVHGQSQLFRSTFSRVSVDRAEEVITAETRFPVDSFGGSLVRNGGSWRLGVDWRTADWRDTDREQTLAGAFAQRSLALGGAWSLQLDARLDRWQNRGWQTSLNPRIGLIYRPAETLSWRLAAYRGFRAPTLNELHRPFRVGDVVTLANDALGEESVVGVEVGWDRSIGDAAYLRLNGYFAELSDPVGNVTLGSDDDGGVLRQRRNLGAVRIRGLELESGWTAAGGWRLGVALLWAATEVRATGRELPQAPRLQGAVTARRRGRWDVDLRGRWNGAQFEDDLNRLELPAFGVLDARLECPLGGPLRVALAVENLLDERYVVGKTPLAVQGPPRTARLELIFRR